MPSQGIGKITAFFNIFVKSTSMMYRQIIVPNERQFTITFPANFVGKEVELIAFTLKETELVTDKEQLTKEALHFWDSHSVDMSNFKFDREEANER